MTNKIEIIPAIDMIGGKCVRLERGDFSRVTEYSGDVLAMAKRLEDAGLRRLHLVDLDAARSGRLGDLDRLASICSSTSLVVDFSGGIRTGTDVRSVLDAGATMVCVGSLAVTDAASFFDLMRAYGPERIILAADVRDGTVAVHGWQTSTQIELVTLLKDYTDNGGRNVLTTDISRDGAMAGPATDLYADIVRAFPTLDVIASGGVSRMDDVDELEKAGCGGVVIGKAIYEGSISLVDLASRKSTL